VVRVDDVELTAFCLREDGIELIGDGNRLRNPAEIVFGMRKKISAKISLRPDGNLR